jgi:hypothetical protein
MRRSTTSSLLRALPLAAIGLSCAFVPRTAAAQATPPPQRDETWGGVSDVLTVASLGTQLLFPRVYYPHAETTEGWKARWHVSNLAPVMTLSFLALFNETTFKDTVKSARPGCDDTNQGGPGCRTYGGPSTHAFAAGSALGYGAAVFITDATKWSHGRVNAPGIVGNLAVPLVFGVISVVGRSAGDYESGGQIVAGGTMGLGVGLLTGLTYALMQRPECGYGAGLVCW